MSRDSGAQPPVRDRILIAAAGAIAAHGYHGMSMRELARASETSLSNLYNYFPSKEEILFALQRDSFEVLITSVGEALEGIEAPDARLYVFISHHVRYFVEHPDVMRVLVHEAASLPAERRQLVRDAKERYFRIAREIVEAVRRQGCGPVEATASRAERDGDESDAAGLDRLTYSLFGMLNWIYGWYDPERHGDAQALSRTIHEIALCGMVARCPFREVQEAMDSHLEGFETPPLLTPHALEASDDRDRGS